ncbi:MAG: hypothetical protein GXY23_05620, partial [Myxococcales bacterium]|nr:hypothetical protein [Myxococcales bacterium]
GAGAQVAPEPDPEPAAPEPPPMRTIAISSDPDGAEVWKGNALIGNTPIDLPVPTEGDPVEYELRYPGYQPKTFPISSATIAKKLSIKLTAEPKKATRTTTTRANTASSMTENTEQKPTRRTPVGVEVLDPWAH